MVFSPFGWIWIPGHVVPSIIQFPFKNSIEEQDFEKYGFDLLTQTEKDDIWGLVKQYPHPFERHSLQFWE